MRVLLDTNGYSALLRGVEPVVERVTRAEKVLLSTVVAGELTLRAKGRPIPTNDIWIAAQAMETGADLLSFDAHFGEVDGLVWVDLSS